MKKAYWWLRVVWLSLRWIPKLNLGDQVWLNGKKWTLNQGVCAPMWDLVRPDCTSTIHAHQNTFKKVRSISNYWHSFRSGYWFYMAYWYKIWVSQGVQPWMLRCNIWAK
jgi:hypothetical protein